MLLIRDVWWLLKCLYLFVVAAVASLFVAALFGRRTPSLLLLQLFNCSCLPNGFSAVTRSVCPPPAPTPYSPSVQLSKSRLLAALARFDYCKLSSAETWSCPLLFRHPNFSFFSFFVSPLWRFYSPCSGSLMASLESPLLSGGTCVFTLTLHRGCITHFSFLKWSSSSLPNCSL